MRCLCLPPTGRHHRHPDQVGLQPGQGRLPLPAQVLLPPPGHPRHGPQRVSRLQLQVRVSSGPGSRAWGVMVVAHSPVGDPTPTSTQAAPTCRWGGRVPGRGPAPVASWPQRALRALSRLKKHVETIHRAAKRRLLQLSRAGLSRGLGSGRTAWVSLRSHLPVQGLRGPTWKRAGETGFSLGRGLRWALVS